jgi:hypothetical protein
MILWAEIAFRIQGLMVQASGFRFRVLMMIMMRNRDL